LVGQSKSVLLNHKYPNNGELAGASNIQEILD